MRVIDYDKLLLELYDNPKSYGNERCAQILELLNRTPKIEAEPVRHGFLKESIYWERMLLYGNCSVCGKSNIMGSNYCSNCGAKMDLEDDE